MQSRREDRNFLGLIVYVNRLITMGAEVAQPIDPAYQWCGDHLSYLELRSTISTIAGRLPVLARLVLTSTGAADILL